MIHRFIGAAALALLLVSTGVARAQTEPPKEGDPTKATPDAPAPAPEPEPYQEEDEGPIEEPEIPVGHAVTVDDLEGSTKKAFVRPTKQTYPIEAIHRPMTLPRFMAQISLDAPFVTTRFSTSDVENPFEGRNPIMWQTLRGAFGITQDLEVGVTYTFGLLNLKPNPGEKRWNAGAGFSFDGALTIWPQHFAVRVSVPFYVDPDAFAIGLNAGIPFRINIGGPWAIFGGHDMLQIKIVGMPVDPALPSQSLAYAAAREVNADPGSANLAINLGAMLQIKPNIVAYGTIGFFDPDLSQDNQTVPLFLGGTWSHSSQLDVGGRIGTYDPAHFGDTFSVSVYAAYRL